MLFVRPCAFSGGHAVSEFDLAVRAELFDGETVANRVKLWISGPGRAFLRLKSSEVAAMMQSTANCKTVEGIKKALESHLEKRASRQKGRSPWDRLVPNGKVTMRGSLMQALESCV